MRESLGQSRIRAPIKVVHSDSISWFLEKEPMASYIKPEASVFDGSSQSADIVRVCLQDLSLVSFSSQLPPCSKACRPCTYDYDNLS